MKDLNVFDKITKENVDLLLEELTNLEKDNLLDIPRDAKVVSDNLIKEFSKKVCSMIK
ncbi:hypothetical protein STFE110948_03045 [Streptobacillus felis]|uniref:hypothetical protein n=1 Tax=Streptobacillus felis TaxID=1384509 RepID=UPI000AD19811|nr:hypothetical protein [Streptobacillus felis]